jgi:hypothetical protein
VGPAEGWNISEPDRESVVSVSSGVGSTAGSVVGGVVSAGSSTAGAVVGPPDRIEPPARDLAGGSIFPGFHQGLAVAVTVSAGEAVSAGAAVGVDATVSGAAVTDSTGGFVVSAGFGAAAVVVGEIVAGVVGVEVPVRAAGARPAARVAAEGTVTASLAGLSGPAHSAPRVARTR